MAFLPPIAYLVLIQVNAALAGAGASAGHLAGEAAATYQALVILANGFIISSLLWGAAVAKIIDHAWGAAARFFLVAAGAALFGVIHSPFPDGRLFLPWAVESAEPLGLAAAYLVMACILLVWDWVSRRDRPPTGSAHESG